MRLNKFKQAKRHFEHSLAVQPNDSDTLRNIAELKKYCLLVSTDLTLNSFKLSIAFQLSDMQLTCSQTTIRNRINRRLKCWPSGK
jgi:hypothetical protein